MGKNGQLFLFVLQQKHNAKFLSSLALLKCRLDYSSVRLLVGAVARGVESVICYAEVEKRAINAVHLALVLQRLVLKVFGSIKCSLCGLAQLQGTTWRQRVELGVLRLRKQNEGLRLGRHEESYSKT